MDEKYTTYNHKETKIDGVEPKHCGTHAIKRGLSNQQECIITAIQRFGECLESKSFVMLDGSNIYNELLESKN